jgi:hypothetical protein
MTHKKEGSALLIVICFMAIISVMTHKLIKMTFLSARQVQQQIRKSRARISALNGITLALTQLNKKEVATKDAKDEKPKSDQVLFLQKMLPILNQWQTFHLTEKLDGINATIKIYLSCEDGKIPLSALFDEKEKKINKDFLPLLKKIGGERKSSGPDFSAKLINMISRKTLDDASQLYSCSDLPFFISPADEKTKTRKEGYYQHDALTDLFSTWNTEKKINPLFLSAGCKKIFNIKNPFSSAKDDKNEKSFYDQIAQTIGTQWGSDWSKNSTHLTTLYKTDVTLPAETHSILSEVIEPKVFSVLSCGIVNGTEQRIYAVMHRKAVETAQPQPDAVPGKNKKDTQEKLQTCLSSDGQFGILRTYWVDEFNNYEY